MEREILPDEPIQKGTGQYHVREIRQEYFGRRYEIIDNIPELINIQPKDGKIKAYQVKEVRNIVRKYKLGEGGTEDGIQ